MVYPKPRTIDIDDRGYFESFRNVSENTLTALSFHSLYTWKDALGLSVIGNDSFCTVFSCCDNGYFAPMGDPEVCSRFIDSLIEKKKTFKIMYLSEARADEYRSRKGAKILVNPDLSEYLYSSQALALKENVSSNYKRRLKKFQSEFDYSIYRIEGTDIPELLELVRSDKHSSTEEYENNVLMNILDSYDRLGFTGIMLRNENDHAFVIGYENTPDIFTMTVVGTSENWQSIAVAACEYELSKIICQQYKYVDLEEDLGIPGLRRIKLLTKPVKMLSAVEAHFLF